ncbi:hypothetical protein GBAR_LOCUS29980, partial [Geodia barretti]
MSYNKERIDILITGTHRTGKSMLVEALVGKSVTKTGSQLLRVGSNNVTEYEAKMEEMEVVVWRSTGLRDGSGKEEAYLAKLKEKCSNVSTVIYCIDISATSPSAAEKALSAIKKLTSTFGSKWWKRSIFVMTRANVLETAKPDVEKRFNDRLQDWKKRIHATLIETGVPEEVAYKIPVEPAGHPKKPRLPGRENWLSALRRVILTSASLPSTTDEADIPHQKPVDQRLNLQGYELPRKKCKASHDLLRKGNTEGHEAPPGEAEAHEHQREEENEPPFEVGMVMEVNEVLAGE